MICFRCWSLIKRPPIPMSRVWSQIALASSPSFLTDPCASTSDPPRCFDCNGHQLECAIRCELTLYASTFWRIAASASNRLLFSAASSAETSFSALDARFRFPDASSARRCCLSDGVSVHSVLSIFVSLDVDVAAENVFFACRSFLGSNAAMLSINGSRRSRFTNSQGGQTLTVVPTSTIPSWALSTWTPPMLALSQSRNESNLETVPRVPFADVPLSPRILLPHQCPRFPVPLEQALSPISSSESSSGSMMGSVGPRTLFTAVRSLDGGGDASDSFFTERIAASCGGIGGPILIV